MIGLNPSQPLYAHNLPESSQQQLRHANTGERICQLLLLLLLFGLEFLVFSGELWFAWNYQCVTRSMFLFRIIKRPMESYMALVAVTNEQNRNSFLLDARLVANDRCLLDASLHTILFQSSMPRSGYGCKCIRFWLYRKVCIRYIV